MTAGYLSEKGALLLLTLIGMAICAGGIGRVAARGEWLHPMAILAYIVGAIILAIAGGTLMGINIPAVDSSRTAIIAVFLLILLKVLISQIHRFVL